MKICRIMKSFPRDTMPGAGLHPYFLTVNMEEPTLVITRKMPGIIRETPKHVTVKEISYRSVPFPTTLKLSWNTLIGLVKKAIEFAAFFFKSVIPLVKTRPDIVHLHSPTAISQGIFAKFFLGSKLVITMHGTDFVYLQKFHKMMQKYFFSFCDMVFYVSERMKRGLGELVPESKLQHTPSGVDLSKFENQNRARKKQLMTIGTFKWQKGYEYLVSAMPCVFSTNSDYVLLIAGDGPTKEAVQKQIHQLGLADKIKLIGVLSRDQIMEYLNGSKLLIMSSVTEGFPKVLLEAMACGTPAVVTNVGSCKYLVQKTGIAVPPKNPEAMAQAINKILLDKELWEELSGNCASVVKEYDWHNICNKVHQAYKKLISPVD